jgi:hypothetical protein
MDQSKPARWFAVSVVLAYIAWLAFVGNISGQELVLGGASAVFSSALSALVLKQMGIPLRIRLRDVVQLLWIPWYLVYGSWEILSVLCTDLAGVKRAESLFRTVSYECLSGPRGFVRRALAVAGTTATPNFIVVGIDTRRELLLFYQIRRSDIPQITKNLGARA